MRRPPFLIALSAFVLGVLVATTFTSAARAQMVPPSHLNDVPTEAKALPKYRIAATEADINKYAAQGYEVKEVSSTATYTYYLMQRYR